MESEHEKQDNRLELAVLVAWSAFFLFVIFSGRLPFYINPKFTALPVLGAVIALAMAATLKFGRRHTDHSEPRDFPVLAWFLMPVIIGVVIAPAGLGAFVVSKRGGDLIGTTSATGGVSVDLGTGGGYKNVTIADLVEPGGFKGGKVSLTGQLLGGAKGLAKNEVVLAHYRMVCCAADVSPVTIILNHPEDYQPKKNQWVRVKGLAKRERGTVVLEAHVIAPAREPSPPYLY